MCRIFIWITEKAQNIISSIRRSLLLLMSFSFVSCLAFKASDCIRLCSHLPPIGSFVFFWRTFYAIQMGICGYGDMDYYVSLRMIWGYIYVLLCIIVGMIWGYASDNFVETNSHIEKFGTIPSEILGTFGTFCGRMCGNAPWGDIWCAFFATILSHPNVARLIPPVMFNHFFFLF